MFCLTLDCFTYVLTFLGKKSLQLRSRLGNSVNKTVRFCNLKVVFRSQRKLNTLFWFKDTLNKKIRSFLVYRYMCSKCNVSSHGKAYHHFFSRAAEHMDVSNLTGKWFKNIKDSAVSDHLLQCNCTIDFDHFYILANDVGKFNVLVKESLLIKRENPVLNRTAHSLIIRLVLLPLFPSAISNFTIIIP